MTATTASTVTVVASHLVPTLGMERCVLRLLDEIGSADVVCVGQTEPMPSSLEATVLGESLRGVRRLLALFRLRRHAAAFAPGPLVAVGVWTAIPLLLVVPRARRRDVIVWEHSLSREKIATSRGLRLLSFVARLVYRSAGRVVCVSDDHASTVGALIGDARVLCIPNFVGAIEATPDGAVAHDLPPSDVAALLAVGSLSATKNHRLLLDALALLPATFRLTIVGDGPLRDDLRAQADALGLAARVDFAGHTEDVAAYYRSSDVVVHPALGETFGLVMLEAAAHRRPVVAVDYPHARSMVPVMVPGALAAPSAAAFAAAIEGQRTTPPTSGEFDAAAARRRAAFDDVTIRRAWRDLFESVSAGGT